MDSGMGGSTQTNTPGGGEKRKRAQNLAPIRIKDILAADEDGIKIEGRQYTQILWHLRFVGSILPSVIPVR